MKIVSFDVNIVPGWENSTSPYQIVTHYRGGGEAKTGYLDAEGIKRQVGHLIDDLAGTTLEKYRQIPYEFRDQMK